VFERKNMERRLLLLLLLHSIMEHHILPNYRGLHPQGAVGARGGSPQKAVPAPFFTVYSLAWVLLLLCFRGGSNHYGRTSGGAAGTVASPTIIRKSRRGLGGSGYG